MNQNYMKQLALTIQEQEKKREKELKEGEEEEERRFKEDSKHLAEEKRLMKQKIVLYKKILAWRDEFIKTKEFKGLFDDIEEDIIIYENGWGHKKPEFEGGCWSRIILDDKGKLEYWAGFKWAGTGPRFTLSKNPKTAAKLMFDYWRGFYETIETGEIYKKMDKELKERD